ncbi:mRNA interferase RelE/StbE [Methanocalculus alkaliphilus]|uniref:type II toxin-antitoxin system RelE family toxin n=1 Tax=Methanocalculus alkaliphilus TaxID=768730 RepID=UPI00209E315F|nr:type II toxin-antitoxin system RelE/ParE family toxin [Methanocalculus alkaliphilus]MCP1715321.1 mRNA interferase RelE/StbE [Methanocalculus alkaliphilus]
MTFEIHYSKSADRDLSRLPIDVIRKIVFAISAIKDDPFAHIQKMKGAKNPPQYRFRVGEYRVILLMDKSEKVLLVDGVGHRSTIYQRYGK